jgi:hypothetical protein
LFHSDSHEMIGLLVVQRERPHTCAID